MASDPNPALRKELTANLAVLDPQIRGIENLMKGIVSTALRDAVSGTLGLWVRRRDFVKNAINALDGVMRNMDALETDGYPTPPMATKLDPALKKELDDFVATAAAGADIFPTMPAPEAFSVDAARRAVDKSDAASPTKGKSK